MHSSIKQFTPRAVSRGLPGSLLPACGGRHTVPMAVPQRPPSAIAAEREGRAPSRERGVPQRQDRRRRESDNGQRQGPLTGGERAPRVSLPSPRQVAVEQLLRIEQQGAYAGLVNGRAGPQPDAVTTSEDVNVDSAVSEAEADEDAGDGATSTSGRVDGGARRGGGAAHAPHLKPLDQRFVKELVAGVTRRRRWLDYALGCLAKRSPGELDPAVRCVLRVGLYELTECDLASHALNEHVELTRRLGAHYATGFVNGVLRGAARALEAGNFPDPEADLQPRTAEDKLRQLAIVHSHPTWMVASWVAQYGAPAAVELMQHNNRRPAYGLRVNLDRVPSVPAFLEHLESKYGGEVQVVASHYLPTDFVQIRSGLQLLLREGYLASGDVTVQDEATGCVVQLLDPRPGERVLDACAAPGGKALYAAQRMKGQGTLVAMDASASRLRAVQSTARRLGLEVALTTRAGDLREYAAAAAAGTLDGEANVGTQFDKVLLDAPCSGTGVLAKRADLRWRRSPEQVTQLTALQDSLLDAAASLTAPGGLVVYSTCSIERAENQERVTAFLARQGGQFAVEAPPEGVLPAALVTAEGFMAAVPHEHGIDGAFAVRFRRKAAT